MGLKNIIPELSEEIVNVLNMLPSEILRQITEIRIRRKSALILVFGKNCLFITKKGKLLNYFSEQCYVVNDDEFDLIFRRLSKYSVHSAIDNLTKGYLMAEGGNRVGVASTAVIKDNEITSVKEIYSLNIRISNEIKDCSRCVLNLLYINSFPSIIVASAPAGGKTTFLRDYVRLLSSGFNNIYRKIVIIDEKNEIAYKSNDSVNVDIGINTDILTGFPKKVGIEIAIRTLSPELIVCDEITSIEEVKAIENGFHSGVKFAVSVHASNKKELADKKIIRELIKTNEFNYIVLLNDYTNDFEIMEVSEFRYENLGNSSSEFIVDCSGLQQCL